MFSRIKQAIFDMGPSEPKTASGQALPDRAVWAMSGLPPIATELRTSRFGSLVPTGDNAPRHDRRIRKDRQSGGQSSIQCSLDDQAVSATDAFRFLRQPTTPEARTPAGSPVRPDHCSAACCPARNCQRRLIQPLRMHQDRQGSDIIARTAFRHNSADGGWQRLFGENDLPIGFHAGNGPASRWPFVKAACQPGEAGIAIVRKLALRVVVMDE